MSPVGTAEINRLLSRPYGTYSSVAAKPNVETLGYCQVSLRDKTDHAGYFSEEI